MFSKYKKIYLIKIKIDLLGSVKQYDAIIYNKFHYLYYNSKSFYESTIEHKINE